MKHVKMLGLAAMAAMALMGLVASSASATALYNGSNVKLGVGSKIVAGLPSGVSATLTTTAGEPLDTCTISEVEGEISNAGGASATVSGPFTKLHWTGCTEPTKTTTLGTLEIHQIGTGTNGTVTGHNSVVKVNTTIFGAECEYTVGETLDLGELIGATGTGKATLAINTVVPAKNSFFCPDARWKTSYEVTSPTGLHVEGS